MNAPARATPATPILRNAAGEPPLGPGGLTFRDDQGEMFYFDRDRSPAAKVGVLELENGKWLAQPPGFRVDQHVFFISREDALTEAVDEFVRRVQTYMGNGEGDGTHWTEDYGRRVIAWAERLRPETETAEITPAAKVDRPLKPVAGIPTAPQAADPSDVLANLDRPISDPIVADLVAAHRARKVYPAGHTFSMTNPVMAGGVKTVGTCSCNHVFVFPGGDYERMDAAIEAHWQKFDALPDKVDGRGFPITPANAAGPNSADGAVRPVRRKGKAAKDQKANGIQAADSNGDERLASAPAPASSSLAFEGAGASDIADVVPEQLRSGPAPESPPDGAGPLIQDAAAAQRQALAAVAAGKEVEWSILRDLVGEGYVYATTTRLVITDEGRAFLESSDGGVESRHAGNVTQATGAAVPGVPLRQGDTISPTVLLAAGLAPGPSEAIQPDAGGHLPASIIADGPERLRSEPAPDASPPGAGSTPSALRAIAVGEQVDGPIKLELVRQGLVHATTTRLSLTEAGQALLKSSDGGNVSRVAVPERHAGMPDAGSAGKALAAREMVRTQRPIAGIASGPSEADRIEQGAPIGAGCVADVKCQSCQPTKICVGSENSPEAASDILGGFTGDCSGIKCGENRDHGQAGSAAKSNAGLETSVTAGETDSDTCDRAAAESGVTAGETALLSDDDDLAIEWPSYDKFLEDKIVTAPLRGIEVARDALHPWLKPHCKDLTLWALRLGCAAIFANFGLHKTAMQLEWCRQLHRNVGGATLNCLPLGVRHGFIKEAVQLGMDVRFIRTNAEFHTLSAEGVVHFLTNYESIREGKLDPNLFMATSLDEASVLRSYGSKTFQEFLPLFSKVLFKLVATATPSPNRYKELIHYAGFLGVMDTGLALTRWFQRNSEKAGDLTLYPHKEDEFWMWVHSWAAFLQRPSELGYSDEGYELPPLKLTWHEVPADHSRAEPERDGQGVMFRNVANGLQQAAKSRRDSLPARIAAMMGIVAQDPDGTWLLWHDLEAEREAIEQALPDVVTIHGSMDIDEREIRLHDFEEGRIKKFATKPILSGSGSNFQYHCHKAIYIGMPGDGYKFNDFIQSLYRLQRFGQMELVEVWIIYSEDMRAGRATLEQKWALDSEMRKRMSTIILAHGLNTLPLRDALARTIGVKRVEVKGQNFIAINNDCVAECCKWPDNSVDQIITSIPFSNHYEYSASYNDFGHTDDNGHFWGQMDFLTSELLRILKPGRLACIHVKDRVLFGSVTGAGFSTVSSFHEEAVMHYKAHGFWKMGMIHIDTDVVKENADGSYRLGWSENCKDSTTKGVGSPEYVLIMRKGQSDRTRGYADVPVVKAKWDGEGLPADEIPNGGYSRARWQIDAHAFWRSSGNRLLTANEFAGLPADTLRKIFAKVSSERIYDYEAHVQIGERLERAEQLPAQWSCLAPGATCENTWHDVIRMHTLNSKQVQQGREKHICPLQFDIVDRLINRYSNEGDLILDPFGGIGTVAYRAILKKRRGAIIELSAQYFLDAIDHCRAAESKIEVPQLFDLATFDAVNTPPPSDMMEIEASDG